MRLISFSVTNFRSITDAHRISIGNSTVLIGKNNEGKSNLLRALNIAMKALTDHAIEDYDRRFRFGPGDGREYRWYRDFPMSLQSRTRSTESIFRLEFSLDEDEVAEFKDEIRSNLNGTLPVEIKFGKTNDPSIHVPKRGPGGTALSAKSNKIAKYIAERIDFNYIPAVRTEDEALSVVQGMLSMELARLEKNADYMAAIKKISDLQQPILDKVSSTIKNSLEDFLPNIRGVSVIVPQAARRAALRNQCSIEIDDGSRTLLQYKGDGVKSLAALGLLKDKRRTQGVSIIAIEEPEAHLHPGAMHGLRDVIEKLTEENQVVITTHCPLFVDRSDVSRNIIINANMARAARDISSIRNILGVRASDNLINASNVLVVEGMEDIIALTPILSNLSVIIGKALKQHQLVIEQIGGAGNLTYKLSTLANALCSTHVLLDNDEAGRKAYENAESDGVLKVADLTLVNCRGMQQSELEDCFRREVYQQDVINEFGVNLDAPAFRGNAKWSDRVKACFERQGKPWGARQKMQLKAVVANAVAQKPAEALNFHKRDAIDSLVRTLEAKLAAQEQARR